MTSKFEVLTETIYNDVSGVLHVVDQLLSRNFLEGSSQKFMEVLWRLKIEFDQVEFRLSKHQQYLDDI